MMAKAPRGASRRTAAAPASSAASAAVAALAQAAPIEEASTPPASAPAAPIETPAPPVLAPEPAKSEASVDAPAKSGKVRWLRMVTGISGPAMSLAPNDKHPFCDVPGDDDAPSEAQRLVDAGFAVDCDPPAEG